MRVNKTFFRLSSLLILNGMIAASFCPSSWAEQNCADWSDQQADGKYQELLNSCEQAQQSSRQGFQKQKDEEIAAAKTQKDSELQGCDSMKGSFWESFAAGSGAGAASGLVGCSIVPIIGNAICAGAGAVLGGIVGGVLENQKWQEAVRECRLQAEKRYDQQIAGINSRTFPDLASCAEMVTDPGVLSAALYAQCPFQKAPPLNPSCPGQPSGSGACVQAEARSGDSSRSQLLAAAQNVRSAAELRKSAKDMIAQKFSSQTTAQGSNPQQGFAKVQGSGLDSKPSDKNAAGDPTSSDRKSSNLLDRLKQRVLGRSSENPTAQSQGNLFSRDSANGLRNGSASQPVGQVPSGVPGESQNGIYSGTGAAASESSGETSEETLSESDSESFQSDFNSGTGNSSDRSVASVDENSSASASGGRVQGPQASQGMMSDVDFENYLKRIGPKESLFKKVEARYREKEKTGEWSPE